MAGRATWHGAAAALCALLLGIGLARFAYTPLIPALITADWLAPPEAVYLGAANLAGYLVGAVAMARARWALGPVALLKLAMAATVASLAACALPWGFWWFLPWRLLAGITGGVLMSLAAPTVLAVTAPERRGQVGGIAFTGVGLGIALSGTLVPLLIERGVAATWLGLAVLGVALTTLAWPGWPRVPAPLPSPAAVSERPRLTLPVTLLALAYACDGFGFVPHSVFWSDYIARGLGQGIAAGGTGWMIFGLGAAVGPILVGMLGGRFGFGRVLFAVMAVKAAAVALPLLASDAASLALSAAVVGALTPGMAAAGSGRTIELLGPQRQRAVWPLMTGVFALAQALGGYAFAYLFARTGDYALLFAIGAGVLAAGALAASVGMTRRASGSP